MRAHDSFDRLAESMAEAGIVKSNMFGMPVLKLGKKPIAGLADDGMNFKLPVGSAEYERAVGLAGAHLFQPVMHGKKGPVMKQWVVVPFDQEAEYEDLALASMKFVQSEM